VGASVLIVHRLSAGSHRYYLRAVGPGLSSAGAVPMGAEASLEELGPDASREPEASLERSPAPPAGALGEAPGRWLGDGARRLGLEGTVEPPALRAVLPSGRGRVAAFDCTFAAPKSVSVLHGLGASAVTAVVGEAHDAAVDAGIAHLERHACAVRSAGRVVEAPGLVVAAFRHRVSRSDDPHLHTHAVVANVATAPDDGRPLALHSPLLYGERRAAGAVYHAVLRAGLSAALGVTWSPPVGGRADVWEVPEQVRAMFSRRRAALLAVAGPDGAERGWAGRVTRPERHDLVDIAALADGWRDRARAAGWEVPDLGPGRLVEPAVADLDRVLPRTDRWTRADVVVAIANEWADGGAPGRLEAECDRALASRHVLGVGPDDHPTDGPGQPGPGPWHQACRRYTTQAALARQARVSEALGAAVDAARAPRSWRERPEELDALRRSLALDGHRLVLVGPDAAVAGALEDRTGAVAVPVARAPAAIATLDLGSGDVVMLVRPQRLDSAQVEAVLVAAGERSVTVTASPLATAASSEMGTRVEGRGQIATVDHLGGDVTVARSAALASATAVEDWLSARRAGRRAVLVAAGAEVDDVNDRARAALRSVGLLGRDEVAGLAVGDVVRFTAARPTLDIDRHDVADVVGVAPGPGQAAGSVRLALGEGRALDLRAAELATLRPAHAVPPVPQLLAGRGEVFVVGGRAVADRHLDGPVHRYLTVSATDGPDARVADRRASLAELDQASSQLRERTRPPPSLNGERRRLEDRARAAAEWVAQAEQRHRGAIAARDRLAEVSWDAQRGAAAREVGAVQVGERDLLRRETLRAALVEAAAPARSELEALLAHWALRAEALVRAAEQRCPPSLAVAIGPAPPGGLVERHQWRDDARGLLLRQDGAAPGRGPRPERPSERVPRPAQQRERGARAERQREQIDAGIGL